MSYAMFIDDQRIPRNVTWIELPNRSWQICRNIDEVMQNIWTRGFPEFISFDHDLGLDEPTGYDIAKRLVEMDMDGDIQIPTNFAFAVHSQNPIGAKNIKRYLDNYMRIRQ